MLRKKKQKKENAALAAEHISIIALPRNKQYQMAYFFNTIYHRVFRNIPNVHICPAYGTLLGELFDCQKPRISWPISNLILFIVKGIMRDNDAKNRSRL